MKWNTIFRLCLIAVLSIGLAKAAFSQDKTWAEQGGTNGDLPLSQAPVAQSLESAQPDAEVDLPEDNIPDDFKLDKEEVVDAMKTLGDAVAQNAAEIVEHVFSKLGKPTAIIVGTEGGAQLIAGFYKGAGQIKFKGAEKGEPIHWNIPTLGFGGEIAGGRVAILVYGATHYEELLQTFAGVKGSAHAVVGGSMQIMKEADKVSKAEAVHLAYINFGVGLGATASAQALTFTQKNCWIGKHLCN